MRVGKTPAAIGAADRTGCASVLVICPAVARLDWIRKHDQFSTRSRSSFAILSADTASQALSPEFVTCSYDLLANPSVLLALSLRRWDLLILDECHYTKGLGAGRTNTILGRGGLIHSCERAWFLSGTPAPNHPAELWPMLYVCGITRLSYEAFVARYCVTNDHPKYGLRIVDGKNITELRTLIAPFTMRRKLDDVKKDLPPIIFEDYTVQAIRPPQHVFEYYFQDYLPYMHRFAPDIEEQERVLQTVFCETGTVDNMVKILGAMDTKKVRSLRRWTGLQKVAGVVDLVKQELVAGAYEKIVIFGVHRDVVNTVRDGLVKEGAVQLYGGTPPKKRDEVIRRFQRDPKCKVFVGNIQAAGTNIDLSVAHDVLMVEADWVPGNNAQAVMRCRHLEQKFPVNVRFVGMADSIDERIQRVLRRKTKTLTELFDAPGVAEIST